MAVERRGPAICNASDIGEGKDEMTKASIDLQDLRRRIYVKAKAEPSWRFWGLYVHVCKMETLRAAYEMARQNDGAPGVDGVTFEAIEAQGVGSLLEPLRDELIRRVYQPLPARRQEIPKDGAKSAFFRYRRSGIGWCKVRSSSYSNLSSRRTSNRDRLDIGPSGQLMTRSSGSLRQSSNGRRAFSTLICAPTSTMCGMTGYWRKWHSGLMTRISCIF